MKFESKREFIKFFIKLAIPVVIQQLLVNLLSITDTVMIGMISEDAISAVTVANKFFLIYNLAIFGLTNGIGLFISQYIGANDRIKYNGILRLGLKCVIVLSVIGTAILCLCPNLILSIFVSNQDIILLGRQYNDIVRFSYLGFGISQMMAVAYRVQGNSQLPMFSGFISFITNVLLNYVLIFGVYGFPQMKIAGAALATLISRYVEMCILIYFSMLPDSEYCLWIKYRKLSFDLKKDIIKKTIPLIFNETIWSLSLSLIFMNYCYVNETFIPALTVVDQISSMAYVAFAGFSTAVGVIIGNTLGANELELARKQAKTMIKVGLSINIIMAIIIASTSFVTPLLFSLGKESTKMATTLLIIKASFMWTQGYSETLYYIFRAGGDTKSVLYIDGMFMTCGPLLMSVIFSRIIPLDLYMLFTVVEGISVLKIVIATYFYRKETWLNNLTVA